VRTIALDLMAKIEANVPLDEPAYT